MNKELKALYAREQQLINEMNNLDDDIYGSKRTYIQYQIEITKRDIQIEQLMQPHIQKQLLSQPQKIIYINEETEKLYKIIEVINAPKGKYIAYEKLAMIEKILKGVK